MNSKLIGILLLSISLTFSGCITTSENITNGKIRDDITIGITSDICGFHPWMTAYDGNTMSINSNIFNSLIELNNDLKLTHALAYNWVNPDNVTWRFYLRDDVKFHNGYNFSASDVKYTIDSIKNDSSNDLRTLLLSIEEVIVADEFIVDIVTREPNPILLLNLVDIYIVSEKYQNENDKKWPVGTGAYKLVQYVENESIFLERFDDYWGESPDVRSVLFKIICESETKKNELVNGTIDVCSIHHDYYDEILSISDLNLKTISIPTVYYIGFDVREFNSSGFGSSKNPLSDVRVRTAMYHAININSIIREELNGFADPASQFLSPFIFGFNPDVKRLPYDLEAAKQLMDEAGYENGFNITLDCVDYNHTLDLCNNIASQLAEININVSLNPLNGNQYYSKIFSGNSSFYIIGWIPTTFDGGEIFDFLIRTRDDENGIGTYNYGYYSNQEVDDIGERISYNMIPSERQQLMQLGFEIAMNDVAIIPLYLPRVNYGFIDFISWSPRLDLRFKVEEFKLL